MRLVAKPFQQWFKEAFEELRKKEEDKMKKHLDCEHEEGEVCKDMVVADWTKTGLAGRKANYLAMFADKHCPLSENDIRFFVPHVWGNPDLKMWEVAVAMETFNIWVSCLRDAMNTGMIEAEDD